MHKLSFWRQLAYQFGLLLVALFVLILRIFWQEKKVIILRKSKNSLKKKHGMFIFQELSMEKKEKNTTRELLKKS